MTTHTFSLIYACARHHRIPEVIRMWMKAADARWAVEIVIVTDGGLWRGEWDSTLNKLCVELKVRREQFIIGCVKNPPYSSARAWRVAAELATGKIIALIADDVIPCGDWDAKILDAVRDAGKEIDDEWVMHVDDLSNKAVPQLVMPIMSRTRMEKVGYFYHPLYTTQFPDTQVEHMAIRDGVLIKALHIVWEHVHPDFGKRPRDHVDELESSEPQFEQGHRLFNWMKKHNFPKPSGLVPAKFSDYCAYMQISKVDFFLFDVMERLVEEGITKFYIHTPSRSWSGEPLGQTDFGNVSAVLSQINKKYRCKIEHHIPDANPLRGESRIETETRVRNDALKDMRAFGWHFPVIVDSDELWVKGTLAKIHALASEGAQSIRCKMITALGMPPNCYLVDGTDRANVYCGPDTEFFYCREPVAPYCLIDEPCIYHFSGVRRTKELLIEKQLGSGHYDDPMYHFDRWMNGVLPNLKIGDKNVSMYGDGSTWPEVRGWTDKDITVLPPAMKEFLQL